MPRPTPSSSVAISTWRTLTGKTSAWTLHSTGLKQASEKFISLLHDNNLSQLQREATRERNVLDLFITNRPALVKHISTVPGVSDHDGAIIADNDVITDYNNRESRKIFVFSKARWQKMREDVADFRKRCLMRTGPTSKPVSRKRSKTMYLPKQHQSVTTSRGPQVNWRESPEKITSTARQRLAGTGRRWSSSRRSRSNSPGTARNPGLSISTEVSLVG